MPSEARPRPQIPQGLYRALPTRPLDETDHLLVAALLEDGRISNAELARRVDLPESTCAGRVRALREAGVIKGVHADVDHAALGRPMEAIVALRFAGHTRASMDSFRQRIAAVPGVIAAYHVAGVEDYLVHVTAPTSDDLRDLVLDHLTSLAGVVHAQTNLVFERIPGRRPLG